jgi:hypothetical protein
LKIANRIQPSVHKSSGKGTARRQTDALDTPESEAPAPSSPPTIQPSESRWKSHVAHVSPLKTSQSFQNALCRSAFDGNKVDTIEPGTEFVPSSDVHEVTRLRQHSGQVTPAKRKAFGEDISDAQLFFWCLLILLVGFYFMFWWEEKFAVGFCDVPQTECISFFSLRLLIY